MNGVLSGSGGQRQVASLGRKDMTFTIGNEADILAPRYGQPDIFAEAPITCWGFLKYCVPAKQMLLGVS